MFGWGGGGGGGGGGGVLPHLRQSHPLPAQRTWMIILALVSAKLHVPVCREPQDAGSPRMLDCGRTAVSGWCHAYRESCQEDGGRLESRLQGTVAGVAGG